MTEVWGFSRLKIISCNKRTLRTHTVCIMYISASKSCRIVVTKRMWHATEQMSCPLQWFFAYIHCTKLIRGFTMRLLSVFQNIKSSLCMEWRFSKLCQQQHLKPLNRYFCFYHHRHSGLSQCWWQEVENWQEKGWCPGSRNEIWGSHDPEH